MRLNLRIVLMLLALVGLAQARPGRVGTLDGHALEGQIRLDSNRLVLVNAQRSLLLEISTTNLLEVVFEQSSSLGFIARSDLTDPPRRREELPPPWQQCVLGQAEAAGEVAFDWGVFRIGLNGNAAAHPRDSGAFAYKVITGDSEIVARVAQVQDVGARALVGLMIRESLEANARHVFLGVTSPQGGVLRWQQDPSEEAEQLPRPDLAAPQWLKLRRTGPTFAALRSANGARWEPVGELDLPMLDPVFVGLCALGQGQPAPTPRARNARSSLDSVREGPTLPLKPFDPRIELRSGSASMARIARADAVEIILDAPAWPRRIQNSAVACIQWHWVPSNLRRVLRAGRPGVLLASGEFVEGEFRGLAQGRVRISSVLLGLRSYELNRDVLALVLHQPGEPAGPFEVTTADGSVWLGTELELGRDEIVLQEPALGVQRVPIYALQGFRRAR